MKKASFALFIFLLCFSSCKDKEEIYYFKYKDQQFEIKAARVLRDRFAEKTNNLQSIKLYFHTKDITFNVEEERGQGAVLKLELSLDSSDIKAGHYDVSDEKINFAIAPGARDEEGKISGSYFKQMYASKIKKDTSVVLVRSGSLEISTANAEHKNDFFVRLTTEHGDSISGHFNGAHAFVNNVDGVKVGEICIGDSVFALQRGDMMLWGDIFTEGINYYELFFYSTDMRASEVGKFQKGLVLVLGLSSTEAEIPADGTYPLSRSIADHTAWTGRKNDNIDWGCYWYNYVTSSIVEKSFINKNSISLQKNGDKFDVTFECIDQLGDTISGYYSSDFKRIDLRK